MKMIELADQATTLFGDDGARTLQRNFAQIEYTAFWCIRMLRAAENIAGVIPETIEDLVIARSNIYELHQVKTRVEQNPWTLAEVMHILCQIYHRRKAFTRPCKFYFVSNGIADNTKSTRKDYPGSLWDLKRILETLAGGQRLTSEEDQCFDILQTFLIPKMRTIMQSQHKEDLTDEQIKDLLLRTNIHTDNSHVCYPTNQYMEDANNLRELHEALLELVPGSLGLTVVELQKMYASLIMHILLMILRRSPEKRLIDKEAVLECRVAARAVNDGIDWGSLPGRSLLEKKAHLGGFHSTEMPTFHRQKVYCDAISRELESLDLSPQVAALGTSLMTLHSKHRHAVCRTEAIMNKPGPEILHRIRPELVSIANKHFPSHPNVDEPYCLGLLWKETDLCSIRWDAFRISPEGT